MKRVNANFSERSYERLVKLAQEKGKTITEVVREAVAFEEWMEETVREGGRILVERDGQIREVVRR
jgi:predicted DNA-binding protein